MASSSCMFVIEHAHKVSDNYHEDGGLVIVAADIDAAKALVALEQYIDITEAEWATALVYPLADDPEPRIFVFPDAGCC